MQNSFSVPLTQLPTDLLMQAPESLRLRGRAAKDDNSEELKRVAFGGDFEKLLAWADAQLSVRKMGEPIGADGNGPDFSCM